MYPRLLAPLVREALADRPVVLLHGARQAGKTTLARSVAVDGLGARYVTLDDATVLAAATDDPDGFVAGLGPSVVIDEVQRAPDLLRAIKAAVDRDRRAGRFLLTGSADVLALPRASESLAGRMEVHRLWPLAQAELDASAGRFVDSIFARELPETSPGRADRRDLAERIVRGGFPEVVGMKAERRRRAWFASYLTAVLQHDVRDLASIESLAQLPRLVGLVAARAPGLLSYSDLARSLAMPQTTLKRYFALLEATFVVLTVPAWSANVGARLVKAPKVVLGDPGSSAHILGLPAEVLGAPPSDAGPGVPEAFGALLEAFVLTEVHKLATWSDAAPTLFHFRTHAGREVDLVLEDRKRRVAGIEVKATSSVSASDMAGLRALAEVAGRRFHRGIVLHLGDAVVPFAHNLHAVPLSALWRW